MCKKKLCWLTKLLPSSIYEQKINLIASVVALLPLAEEPEKRLSDTLTCDSRTNMSSCQVNLQINSPSSEHGAHTHLWLPSFLQPTRGCWQLITAAMWGSHPDRVRGLSWKYSGELCTALRFQAPAASLLPGLNFFFVLDVRKEIKSSALKIHFQAVNQMSTETTLGA